MIKNFWWENQSNRENWLGGPTSKERAYALTAASTLNRNETRQKKTFLKIWNPLCELYTLCEEVSFFFLHNVYETVSGSLNCSEVRGAQAWVKLCVGGDWQWKLSGQHSVGRGKKHMWNITERKCHRKILWGSILQGESEQRQTCCAFAHLKRNPTSKRF